MLGILLQRYGHGQQAVSRNALSRMQTGDGRTTLRQGSSLIENDCRKFLGLFQRIGIPEQNTILSPSPCPDHDGRWCGQTKRAGTGNDENGNS